MYYRFTRRFNYLTVDDTFARLLGIDRDGSLRFEFRYTVSQRDAVKSKALTVKVSVVSRTIKPPSLLGDAGVGNIDAKQLIGNVLQQVTNAKAAIQKQQTYVVASRNSDISAFINNDVVTQLARGGMKGSIQQLNTTKLALVPASTQKQSNDPKPVLTFASMLSPVSSSTMLADPKALMHQMVTVQGIDPSSVLQQSPRSTSAADAFGGINRTVGAPEYASVVASQLHDFYVFHPTAPRPAQTSDSVIDSELMHIVVSDPSEDIEPTLLVTIPGATISDTSSSTQFQVRFDMVDGDNGVTIDTVMKPLDVSKHVQLFNTPRIPPIVKVARSQRSGTCLLEVKQLDPGAKSVNVYKKVFSTSVPGVDEYTHVGTYNVSSQDQTLLVEVIGPTFSPAIYRVVPVGAHGTLSPQFTNVVVKPPRPSYVRSVALTTALVSTGVQVEVTNIPRNVVAFAFIRRNVTTHQQTPAVVNGDFTVVDAAARVADHLSIVDTSVFPENTYEFAVRLVYDNGSTQDAGHTLMEVIAPDPGAVSTVISDLQVSRGVTPGVSFTIATTVVNTNNDVIKSLLQRQDLYDQFKDDVLKEREFLMSLLAHNVQRVNVSTGQREDFGTVTSGSFSDAQAGAHRGVSPLEFGFKYRYEVQPMLRAPETMFQTLNKVAVDASTKKPYVFSPAKFMHPVALTRGVLMSQQGLSQLFSKHAMEWGSVGTPQVIEASFDGPPARIIDARVARFSDTLNVLTWRVQGELQRIDHFIVMTQVHGIRTLIGKAHALTAGSTVQYLHDLKRTDVGQLTYVLVPVFDDYAVGEQVETNDVAVEEVPVT